MKDALSLSRCAGVPLSLMNKRFIFFSFVVVVWIATAAVGQASAHPALVNSQATNCRSCHTEVFQQRPVLHEPAIDDCSSRHSSADLDQVHDGQRDQNTARHSSRSFSLALPTPEGRGPAYLSECGLSKQNVGKYPLKGLTFRRSTVAWSGIRAGLPWHAWKATGSDRKA